MCRGSALDIQVVLRRIGYVILWKVAVTRVERVPYSEHKLGMSDSRSLELVTRFGGVKARLGKTGKAGKAGKAPTLSKAEREIHHSFLHLNSKLEAGGRMSIFKRGRRMKS